MSKGTIQLYGAGDVARQRITGTISFEHPGFVTVRADGTMTSYPNIHVHKIEWEVS